MQEIKIKSATFKGRKLIRFTCGEVTYYRGSVGANWIRESATQAGEVACQSNHIVDVLAAFGESANEGNSDKEEVNCKSCGHKHLRSDRISVVDNDVFSVTVCPSCKGDGFEYLVEAFEK